MKLLVVSPGGCACTAFISFIKQYVNVNNTGDRDFLKHNLPDSDEIKKYKATHIIYIYGDISKAIRSLFRRNYNRQQYNKLRNRRRNKNNVALDKPIEKLTDYVKQVEETNEEPLGIINHYNAWKNEKNVFFIHYESIPISTHIDDFLELPKGTCANFILKERKSLIDNTIETANYLIKMDEFSKYTLLINDSLNNPTPGKCANRECKFLIHTKSDNNNGKYCCLSCKNSNRHGPICERVTYNS